MDEREERIRKKARELWWLDGRPEGKANEHWYRAEDIVRTEDFDAKLGRKLQMEQHNSTEEAIGLLLLCQCNQLDPCCIQHIALTSFRDRGFGNPIFRAALLCVLSQWYAQQRPQLAPEMSVPQIRGSGAPLVQAPAAYAMQAPAAPCTTNIAPFLFTLIDQGFAKSFADFFMGTPKPCAP
jgi:hypothetical protein